MEIPEIIVLFYDFVINTDEWAAYIKPLNEAFIPNLYVTAVIKLTVLHWPFSFP